MPFENVIKPENRNARLAEEIVAEELSGVFNWALEGLHRLIKRGFIFEETERTTEIVEKYRIESSSVLSFIDQCCVIAPMAECGREILFQKYRTWALDGSYRPFSRQSFNKMLEESFGDRIQKSLITLAGVRVKGWKGIGMAVDA